MTDNRPTHTTCRLCGAAVPVATRGRIRDAHPACLRVLWSVDRLQRELAAAVPGMDDLAAVQLRRKVAAAVQSGICAATNGALARTRPKR